MKKEIYNDKKIAELEKLLKEAQRSLLDLRIDNGQRKLKDGHKISLKRKEIARIKTAIREKELANVG